MENKKPQIAPEDLPFAVDEARWGAVIGPRWNAPASITSPP